MELVVIARAPTGLIVRGGPGTHLRSHGDHHLVVEDFDDRSATPLRLARILEDAAIDPIAAVFRHFETGRREVFAILGPRGTIVGSTPFAAPFDELAIEHGGGTVRVAFADEPLGTTWCSIPIGSALCFGRGEPELLCDLRDRRIATWSRHQTLRPTARYDRAHRHVCHQFELTQPRRLTMFAPASLSAIAIEPSASTAVALA